MSSKVSSRPASACSKIFKESEFVRRRNIQHKFYEYWNDVNNHFQKVNTINNVYSGWSSPNYYNSKENTQAAATRNEEKRKELIERKVKLAQLLIEELNEQEQQCSKLTDTELHKENRDHCSLDELRSWHESLKRSREECQKKEKDLRLHLHWKINEPLIRQFEKQQDSKNILKAWSEQVQEKEERKQKEQEEMKKWIAERERMRQEEEEKEKAEYKMRKDKEISILKDLDHQKMELKEKEALVQHLLKLEAATSKKLTELNELMLQEQELERKYRSIQTRQILQHQCKIKLQKHMKEVQEELAEDLKIMDNFLTNEIDETEKVTAEKLKQCKEIEFVRESLERQKEIEKQRRKEMEFIFSEEAEKMWKKLELQWASERNSRMALLKEVLATRQRQIQEKLRRISENKQEAENSRQEILKKIDAASQEMERERKELKNLQQKAKTLLDVQVSLRKNKELEKIREERLQLEEEKRKTEKENEKLLLEFYNIEKDINRTNDFRRRRFKW